MNSIIPYYSTYTGDKGEREKADDGDGRGLEGEQGER